MIVLHLYQHLHPQVARKLLHLWPEAKIINAGHYDTENWDVIKKYWGEDDIVLIEQHKILHAEVFNDFLKCPRPYCLNPHELEVHGNWARRSIGCVRWRKELQQRVTAADVEAEHDWLVEAYGNCDATGVCWRHTEFAILQAAEKKGYRVHEHWPGVMHWGLYKGRDECGKFSEMPALYKGDHSHSIDDDHSYHWSCHSLCPEQGGWECYEQECLRHRHKPDGSTEWSVEYLTTLRERVQAIRGE